MQAHHTRTKIATLRQREQADESEVGYLEDLAIRGFGADDYVDSLVDMYQSARTGDGFDERQTERALRYSGLACTYRRY